jgi:hypothetical protein
MQMRILVSWVLKTILLILSTFSIGSSILFFSVDYQSFTRILLTSLGKLHRLQEFQQQYITSSTFSILRAVIFVVSLFNIGLTIGLWHKMPQIVTGLLIKGSMLSKKITKQIYSFSLAERRLILILWLIISAVTVYNAIYLPISYDEAWTYLNLSSKNIFVSASYYPAPNNHIFFTLLTNLTTWLPIDPTFAVRLPNLLVTSIAFFLILFILKDIFYPALAIILSTLFYSFYPGMVYSVQARGYFLYMLFAAVIYYLFYKNRYHGKNSYWACFGVAAALGFYTIPSFLYAFLTVFSIAFLFFVYKKDFVNGKKLMVTSSITAIGVILLYTPVFLVSGIGAVANNSYIQQKTFIEIIRYMPNHLMQTANWYMGNISAYTYIVMSLLLMSTILLSMIRKEKRLLAGSICITFICPIVFMVLHRTLPFERTWSYTLFFIILCVGVLISLITTSANIKKGMYAYSFGILIAGLILFYTSYKENYAIDYDSKNLAEYLLANNCHRMYIQNDYQEVLLYYYYTINGQVYEVDNGFVGKAMDSSKDYDCLLINMAISPQKILEKYYPADVSKFITVYVKHK